MICVNVETLYSKTLDVAYVIARPYVHNLDVGNVSLYIIMYKHGKSHIQIFDVGYVYAWYIFKKSGCRLCIRM